MKSLTFLLLLISTFTFAQQNSAQFKADILKSGDLANTDIKNQITPYDIAAILTRTDNSSVVGFIGSEYERIRMKFISVIKNKDRPDQYFVYGKSMVKDNVCEFLGTLTINAAYYLKDSYVEGVKRGVIIGDYSFLENPTQKHVGQFKGIFKTNFYLDKENKIQYDDLSSVSDEFSNNDFVGIWTNYNGKLMKECNWGDHRIQMSGDLDDGAGEFHPNQKYAGNGWLNYSQSYGNNQNSEASKKEHAEWWK